MKLKKGSHRKKRQSKEKHLDSSQKRVCLQCSNLRNKSNRSMKSWINRTPRNRFRLKAEWVSSLLLHHRWTKLSWKSSTSRGTRREMLPIIRTVRVEKLSRKKSAMLFRQPSPKTTTRTRLPSSSSIIRGIRSRCPQQSKHITWISNNTIAESVTRMSLSCLVKQSMIQTIYSFPANRKRKQNSNRITTWDRNQASSTTRSGHSRTSTRLHHFNSGEAPEKHRTTTTEAQPAKR